MRIIACVANDTVMGDTDEFWVQASSGAPAQAVPISSYSSV